MNNTKIDELIKQAMITYPPVTGKIHYMEFDKYKFAQLLIEQCIEIVKPSQYHYAYPDNMIGGDAGIELLEDRVNKIKQHFGVEDDL